MCTRPRGPEGAAWVCRPSHACDVDAASADAQTQGEALRVALPAAGYQTRARADAPETSHQTRFPFHASQTGYVIVRHLEWQPNRSARAAAPCEPSRTPPSPVQGGAGGAGGAGHVHPRARPRRTPHLPELLSRPVSARRTRGVGTQGTIRPPCDVRGVRDRRVRAPHAGAGPWGADSQHLPALLSVLRVRGQPARPAGARATPARAATRRAPPSPAAPRRS